MKVIHIPDDFKLTIEFNRRECQALAEVCARVGGSDRSSRGVFKELDAILSSAGFMYKSDAVDEKRKMNGAIYFVD